MKITINNYDLKRFTEAIASEDSIRNNTHIKLSGKMNWALRVNLNAMANRYKLFEDARNELGQRFIDEGKTEDDKLKPEYINEYNMCLLELYNQTNELEFTPIKREDFEDLEISMTEYDLLDLMVEEA